MQELHRGRLIDHFLLDPGGNNIEAVYHGPTERSADSVSIRFDA
jgi:hypothetical protein